MRNPPFQYRFRTLLLLTAAAAVAIYSTMSVGVRGLFAVCTTCAAIRLLISSQHIRKSTTFLLYLFGSVVLLFLSLVFLGLLDPAVQ